MREFRLHSESLVHTFHVMALGTRIRDALPIPLDRAELSRRLDLASEPNPVDIPKPGPRLLLAELGYVLSPGRRVRQMARGKLTLPKADQPKLVMLLPGFATHPARMRYFAQVLETAGHTVKRWGMGFNWGPSEENFAALEQRLLDLHKRDGNPLHLVGWSLGGLFARELAKRHPHCVAQVITMGTPFSYSPRANNAWRIYQFIAGHRVDEPPVAQDIAAKPPVDTVALWSASDGVIHPRAARGKPGERDRAIALRCGHIGFAHSHESILAVARELQRV